MTSTTRNNFDLLRLLLAAIVCLVHSYALSVWPALSGLGRWLSSDMAFKVFFVVSGYLIYMSYERSNSFGEYIGRRFRRIYPAYAMVVLASAFGLYFVGDLPAKEYFSGTWIRYLAANLTFLNFLQPTLPGVFTHQHNAAINGALWTLKVEVSFYLFLPVLAWAIRRLGANLVLVSGFVASIAWIVGIGWLAQRFHSGALYEAARQLPGQLCYFIVGMALVVHRERFARWRWPLAALALVFALAHLEGIPGLVLDPLAFGILAIGFATGPYVGYSAPAGDLSYGIYLWHFPILQCLIATGAFAAHPWLFVLTALLLAAIAALCSWHWVERPFLSPRNHYRTSSGQAPELAGAEADSIP